MEEGRKCGGEGESLGGREERRGEGGKKEVWREWEEKRKEENWRRREGSREREAGKKREEDTYRGEEEGGGSWGNFLKQ